eukprot:Skav216199  [mRNA]  locus=scaffold1222:95801:96079:- [translate_table: standard]
MEELRAYREASCGERHMQQLVVRAMLSHAGPCWAQVPLLTSQITRVGRRYMRPGRSWPSLPHDLTPQAAYYGHQNLVEFLLDKARHLTQKEP